MSLLRIEKSADSLLKISSNIVFSFISLLIFVPLISIMRFYFEGASSTPDTFIDFVHRLSIWKGVIFIMCETAGLAIAGFLQARALKMYDYIESRRSKQERFKAKGRI